jgi:hypothetical protein
MLLCGLSKGGVQLSRKLAIVILGVLEVEEEHHNKH